MAIDRSDITGVILAGGLSRRLHGVPKALIDFGGQPLIGHVFAAFKPQVGSILINANDRLEAFAGFGVPVIADTLPGHRGPLAGIVTAMAMATTSHLAIVPCDSPFLPRDLVARLAAALSAHGGRIAVAAVAGRWQPVFALLARELLADLNTHLAAGGSKIDHWYRSQGACVVDFSDEGESFLNINTAEDLQAAAEHFRGQVKPTRTFKVGQMAAQDEQTGSKREDYDPDSLDVATALARILDHMPELGSEEQVELRQSIGRVLSRPVVSDLDVPSHRNSAMDGYAIRCSDADGQMLQVIGTALAGHPYTGSVGAGQAVRIMTGAVVPDGADCVAMQEHVVRDGDRVRISSRQTLGQHIREAGEDLRVGARVFEPGRLLLPADLGLIASLGIGSVFCRRPARVAFFSTGDEIRSIGSTLGPGEIYDSNRYTLHGMLTRLPVTIQDLGVIPDRPDALRATLLDAAAHADVILTSGGVSVGEADYIKDLLTELGTINFWKVAMKPGRPLAFGRIGDAMFFGLPGNPVSVMVTFYLFVRPALLRLLGCTPPPAPVFPVRTTELIRKRPGRTEYQRGILRHGADGSVLVAPTGEQGSGILSSMSFADCFIILPAECGNVAAGEVVQVQPFHGFV